MDFVVKWVKKNEPKPLSSSFDFFLTSFIYPLKEPLVISKELGLVLDNLRTDEEINFFENAIKGEHNKENGEKFQINTSLKNSIEFFREVFEPLDLFIAEFFQDYNYEQLERQVAKMLVVLRFKSDRNADKIKKQYKLSIQNLDLDGEKIDGEQFVLEMNRENAINYTYILSLLTHKRGKYFDGESFLVYSHNYYVLDKTLISKLENTIWLWLYGISAVKDRIADNKDLQTMQSHDWGIFYLYLNHIKEVSKGLENLIEKGKEEQLIYVGELIRQSFVISNEKTQLIALVSAIELLLTHNPDHNRFNVEDSITKQFVLKTAIIVYKKDKSKDIDLLGARLKEIYNQRSNIAHGNFKEYNKFLRILETRSDLDQFFVSLIEDSYWYIRLIVETYIEDYQYIDFLKKQ